MHIAAAICGLIVILFVLVEAFEGLVLPRRVLRPFRFTRLYYHFSWRAWTAAARLIRVGPVRQSYLSIFGPLSLLVLFAIWTFVLMGGFGLVHYGVGPEDRQLSEALYLSGTTFTTLGYGDVTPATPVGRVVSVIEAATGFGFFAVVIAYLPVLNQSFGRREAFLATLDAKAGSPPAAGRLVLRVSPSDRNESILLTYLIDAERWAAELLEGHLSFPVMGQYRSQHDNQSWLAALACMLDVSALLLTVIDSNLRMQARLTFAMARHTAVDLGLVIRRAPAALTANRLPPERLNDLLEKLRATGAAVRDDESARAKLAELRELYEPFVAGLAEFYRLTVPDVWPADERPDNWRTSAWQRRAAPLSSLGVDPEDDHFA